MPWTLLPRRWLLAVLLVASLPAPAEVIHIARPRLQPLRPAEGSGLIHSAGTVPECTGNGGAPIPCAVSMVYFGGSALSNVKVYAVFWTGAVSSEIRLGMGDFYRTLTDSEWMDWLTEYSTDILVQAGNDQGQPGTGQLIGRGTFAGSYTLTTLSRSYPSCPAPDQALTCVTDAEIANELDVQIGNQTLPAPDANTLYMVHFPATVRISDPGAVSCQQYCAYHSVFQNTARQDVFYAVLPDFGANGCQRGCGLGTTFQNTCSGASHEIAESITDAEVGLATAENFPLAWYDDEQVSQGEIGDMCNQDQDTVGTDGLTGCDAGTTGCYTLQQLFSHLVWNADPTGQPNVPACVSTRHDADDYSLALSPNSATVVLGDAPVSIPIVTAVTGGSALPLLLSVTGAPAGVVASIDAPSITAGATTHLSLFADAGTPPVQDGLVVVRATATTVHSAALLVQVVVPTNDWSLALSPAQRTLFPGTTQTFTVSGQVTAGAAEAVTLDAAVPGLPSGVTASFGPASLVPGASTATLTLTASPSASGAAPASFTVHGTSASAPGGHLATGQVQVDTLPSVAFTSPAAGATLSGTTSLSVTAAAGANTSLGSLTFAVDGAAPLATGTAQTVSWDTRTVPNGSHLVQVTVVDADGGQSTASVQVTVSNVIDDFTLSVSPPSQALAAGGSVTYSATTGVAAGNAETVTLAVSGLPSGVQGTFAPPTVTAGNTSVLTLTAPAGTAAAASTSFTVLGTSPSQPSGHTATALVSITAASSGSGGTGASSSGCSSAGSGAASAWSLLALLGAALCPRAISRRSSPPPTPQVARCSVPPPPCWSPRSPSPRPSPRPTRPRTSRLARRTSPPSTG